MCVTRRTVLAQLVASTDAERRETTTTDALASALVVDKRTVAEHLNALVACELTRIDTDGSVRATISGEGLLTLDTDGVVIIDPPGRNGDADA
jgi:Mn-dependent DtxR family transcriptional regulator